jgi:hypothetical protein
MASLGGTAFFVDQTHGRIDAREKLSKGHSAQSRTLGGCHCAAHVRATND